MKNWQHEPVYFGPVKRLGGGWIAYKDSPSPPAQPDYAAAARAQGSANVDAARLTGRMSNPNIYTPYGSQVVTWGNPNAAKPSGGGFGNDELLNVPSGGQPTQGAPTVRYGGEDGTTPFYLNADGSQYNPNAPQTSQPQSQPSSSGQDYGDQPTVTQTLSPAQQRLLESQQGISQKLADLGSTGVDRVSQTLLSPFDLSGGAKAATDKAYAGLTARLDPQWAQNEESNRAQLANQGITQGSQAYDNAMRTFNQGKNDAYNSAQLSAQQLAPQTMQMDITGRDQLLNELNAVRSGAQVQNPQFQPFSGSSVAPAPIMGATQATAQGEQNAYNAQMAGQNAMMGGLFGLGGAALMSPAGTFTRFSDRRLKSNITRVGTHRLGIGVYEYDIAGIRQRGVMADELEQIMPNAVMTLPTGYKKVNYALIS